MNSSSVFLPLDSLKKPRDTTKDKLNLLEKYNQEDEILREEVAETNRKLYEEQLQERINRMHCAREKQKREDSEYNKKKIIQMFINNCDDIRPKLRKLLQKDSKICQLEQIKDHLLQQQEQSDLKTAWDEISTRTYQLKTDNENHFNKIRRQQGLDVQKFLGEQIYEKNKKLERIFNEEVDQEKKWVLEAQMVEVEERKREIEKAIRDRQIIAHAIETQIKENRESLRKVRENVLSLERNLNEKAKDEIDRENHLRKVESENFREEVFQYMEHLKDVKKEIKLMESEKQKLIDDQKRKMLEEELQQIRDFEKKRALVNQEAREIQYQQIKRFELEHLERKNQEKQENYDLEKLVQDQRREIREKNQEKKILAKNYGKFLMEQIKDANLRREDEKQKLRESIQRVEYERARFENIGREFVESYQDVLPLHPNLRIIKGFNQNHV